MAENKIDGLSIITLAAAKSACGEGEKPVAMTKLFSQQTTGSGEIEYIDTGLTISDLSNHKRVAILYFGDSNTSVYNLYVRINVYNDYETARNTAFFRTGGASSFIVFEIRNGYFFELYSMSSLNPSLKELWYPYEDYQNIYNHQDYLKVSAPIWRRFKFNTTNKNIYFAVPASTTKYTCEIFAFD